ncbi:hypothetical protein R6Q59_011833 [Mikania micrantha]|uniref:YTH domain-containing family protein n=1 Tax=Mikania micrantha TaxID=192012 RepID=A0A5N6N282_9ASTR|nr:hypothetical protein E3N88_24355 [Mikania micrantha]
MAAGGLPADDAADLMENLSLDSQTKSLETSVSVKKLSVDTGSGHVQNNNNDVTPLVPEFMDPTFAYYQNIYPYYYGGYDETTNDLADYFRYVNPEGFDLAHGVYGYAPYGAYSPAGSPAPTVAYDGQFFGAQHYQYPNQYFQPATPIVGPCPATTSPTKGEATTPKTRDQPSLAANSIKGSGGNHVGSKGNNDLISVKLAPYQNSAFNANGSYGGYPSIPWLDGSMYSDPQARNKDGASRDQNLLKGPNSTSGSSVYMNRMYPNKLYSQYGNISRSGYFYGTNVYGLHNGGRGWLSVDNKFKPRARGNGFYNNDNNDGLNELNRGPRSRITKNQKPIATAITVQDITSSPTGCIKNDFEVVKEVNITPNREQYNKAEFPEEYVDAKLFIIKSYSEDDVHKSIKYNVWASTQNGNKKLDAAYHEAQQKSNGCPVFLFFSVNTSGQFVGVAEMVGPVDFKKILEYWQQDKWIGCFPVKWHIVKDLPNGLLKHIILENNENKPVTNSRDTQEVKLVQGLQMIKIFKEHSSKQCILDDFEFYEERQNKIQQKKAKQQQFLKQAWEGKPFTDDEKVKEEMEGEIF